MKEPESALIAGCDETRGCRGASGHATRRRFRWCAHLLRRSASRRPGVESLTGELSRRFTTECVQDDAVKPNRMPKTNERAKLLHRAQSTARLSCRVASSSDFLRSELSCPTARGPDIQEHRRPHEHRGQFGFEERTETRADRGGRFRDHAAGH